MENLQVTWAERLFSRHNSENITVCVKVDAYIDDDGNLKFDLNFDGVFDDLENTEEGEWGQGSC